MQNTIHISQFDNDISKAIAAARLTDEQTTIYFDSEIYQSPTGYIDVSNISFVGNNMPQFNSDYTKLKSGTIFSGHFNCFGDNIKFENIGIDATITESEGLIIHNNNSVTKKYKGVVLKNIIALLKKNILPFHAIMVSGYEDVIAENIITCYGNAGLVFKAKNVKLDKHTGYSHPNYSLLFKSDDYGVSENVFATNIIQKKAFATDGSNAVYVLAASANTKNINISNVFVEDCSQAIIVLALSTYNAKNINISKVVVEKCLGVAIETNNVSNCIFSEIIVEDSEIGFSTQGCDKVQLKNSILNSRNNAAIVNYSSTNFCVEGNQYKSISFVGLRHIGGSTFDSNNIDLGSPYPLQLYSQIGYKKIV